MLDFDSGFVNVVRMWLVLKVPAIARVVGDMTHGEEVHQLFELTVATSSTAQMILASMRARLG